MKAKEATAVVVLFALIAISAVAVAAATSDGHAIHGHGHGHGHGHHHAPARLGKRDECAFGRMKEPYLESGYRIGYNASQCISSVFEIHNETLNIHTHALALISWLWLAWHTFRHVLPTNRGVTVHHFWFAALIFPNAVSMASSVVFHTFRSIEESVYARLARIDFTCIVLVLVGSQLGQLYYAFANRPTLRHRYLVSAAVLGALGVAYCSVPSLTIPALRVLRTLVFVAIGSIDLVATVHACALEWGGRNNRGSRFWLISWWVIWAYLGAAIAVAVYIPRFPERVWPGRFDTTLQSHVIMHITLMFSEWFFWWHYVINFRALEQQSSVVKKVN